MDDLSSFLKRVNDDTLDAFKGQKRILSFQQYLEAFTANPVRLGRSAAQYLLDVFEHFGTREVENASGKVTQWKLFDAPWDNGRSRMAGQGAAQNELYRHVRRFAASGRTDKLLLLHGPNGSGKSTLMDLIFGAMEHYSTLPEGALFRFNWIFTERSDAKSMGFGAHGEELPKETLAFVDNELVACKLISELREPPLFLVPPEHRAKLLDALIEAAQAAGKQGRDIRATGRYGRDARTMDLELLTERLRQPFLREGALSPKNKQIFDALLIGYRGDWLKVVRHVQVERYFISRRYRTGAAAIEPQQAVDAESHPLEVDHGVALPPMLQGLPLRDLSGELIEANGGMVEYSDFLKRNLELNKYLLTTVERGEVSLPGAVAQLNLMMFATCNEKQLSAFKAIPDFTSYKGRIELVRVPYLLEWQEEQTIYQPFIDEIRETRHVAPHTAAVAALWAVLTRLKAPDPGNYPSELASTVRNLTPLDKAKLYNNGAVPDDLSSEEKRLLRAHVQQMRDEHRESTAEFEGFLDAAYEGRRGASAREMKSLLATAASDPTRKSLSPLGVFAAMERLAHDTSVYDFLRLEADEGYHDCEAFTRQVEGEYFRWVSVEVYDSMGLVEETEYDRRVEDYFKHARAYVAGEKVANPRTGAFEDPSEEVLEGLEKLMPLREAPDAFRRNLMTRIAAYSLEHPKEKLNYHEICSDLFRNLRESYYKDKAKPLIQLAQYILVHGTEDSALIPPGERPKVERTLRVMREKYGYSDESAKEAIAFVLQRVQEKQ